MRWRILCAGGGGFDLTPALSGLDWFDCFVPLELLFRHSWCDRLVCHLLLHLAWPRGFYALRSAISTLPNVDLLHNQGVHIVVEKGLTENAGACVLFLYVSHMF